MRAAFVCIDMRVLGSTMQAIYLMDNFTIGTYSSETAAESAASAANAGVDSDPSAASGEPTTWLILVPRWAAMLSAANIHPHICIRAVVQDSQLHF